MNGHYEPPRDFVRHVMERVRTYETRRWALADLLERLRLARTALLAGGALAGLFGAAPVF